MADDLAPLLAAAHKSGRHEIDARAFAGLDRDGGYRVQQDVLAALGETAGAYKVAIWPDGSGNAAPIPRSNVGESGRLKVPSANFIGLEVEIAAILGNDIDASTAAGGDAALLAVIDHFVLGFEIVGARYADRTLATQEVGLADGMGALGYAYNPAPWTAGLEVAGKEVSVEFGGKQVYAAPAKHSFGTVLASFLAYARAPRPELPLRKGMIVTTGSLCGLVAVSGPGVAVGHFGGSSVSVELV